MSIFVFIGGIVVGGILVFWLLTRALMYAIMRGLGW